MENVLDANGVFWWGSEKFDAAYVAPVGAVAGHLTVDPSGVCRLSLLGLLTPMPEAAVTMFKPTELLADGTTIHGLLIGGRGAVVLGRIRRDGSSMSSYGISFEKFVARDCLFYSDERRPPASLKFNTMWIEMVGIDEWFSFEGIEVKRLRGGYQTIVKMPAPTQFDLEGERLQIKHEEVPSAKRVRPTWVRKVDVHQRTVLTLSQRQSKTLEQHRTEFRLFEDLFLLLVGEPVQLTWPELRTGSRRCVYYFQRQSLETQPLRWTECWTSWSVVKSTFGQMFKFLRAGHDAWGPGLYLYIGTRRAPRLHLENAFVNMIWGLESLHRRGPVLSTSAASGLQEKVERILSSLGTVLQPKDRRWLTGRLKYAGEPSLEERLFDLFSELPPWYEPEALREFCKECADIRNEISHFGGERHGKYSDFLSRLYLVSRALQVLYHSLLLTRLGLAAPLLQKWVLGGPNQFKRLFEDVGLKLISGYLLQNGGDDG